MTEKLIASDINWLNQEQLDYELTCRGANPAELGTVEIKRKQLRTLLAAKREGLQVTDPIDTSTFPEGIASVKTCIERIRTGITELSDNPSKEKKLLAEMHYAIRRLNACNSETVTSDVTDIIATKREQKAKKEELSAAVAAINYDLSRAIKKLSSSDGSSSQFASFSDQTVVPSNHEIPLDVSGLQAAPITRTHPNASSSPLESSSDNESDLDDTRNRNFRDQRSHVIIAKWNLKFSGEGSTSINAFLEKVEETALARGVTPKQLYQSALDLFTGRALTYYRAIRTQVHNWKQLTSELREEFLPPDYNQNLYEEIKHRTQGSSETIGMYIAIMQNLFNRMRVPVTEQVKLKIILNNLMPLYQQALMLTDVTSIEQLKKLGRHIEARKQSVQNYIPPARRGKALEPDLAYVDPNPPIVEAVQPSVNRPNRPNRTKLQCWNCGAGHIFRDCDKPLAKFCFRCGHKDTTSHTCPKCAKNSQPPTH